MMTALPGDFAASVRAQADFRLKFGVPMGLAIVAILYWVSPDNVTEYQIVGAAVALYIAYTVCVRILAGVATEVEARRIVIATAICDPIFLSVWLYAVGDPAILFVGLYTFTVLGFGFRIGTWAMFLCQGVSIACFIAVLVSSPRWAGLSFSEASHIVMMVLVPVYAATLIRRLHTAKALAEHESQAKSMLLAKVSHELRTPLTGIVSAAQLIEMESRDPHIAGRAQAIHDMATGLDAEIGRMLDVAKMEATGESTAEVSFEVAEAAGHVLRTLQPVAAVKGLELNVQIDPRITKRVRGSAKELDGVLVNLAGNAIKFTQTGSVAIRVELVEERRTNYRLRFSVQDTGIGIPEEHLSRIFEPFYQVESGPNRRFGGTGLGTTIAMECVRRLGGELKVESTVGEGTRFWFEIDFETATEGGGTKASKPAAPVVRGKRVLIADDNRVNLELLRQMLLKDSHRVTTATSGTQALQLLAREEFDLVLLDFNLGDIDGAAVFQTYAFGRVRTAPTYFITADTTKVTAKLLEEVGADGVIYKPLTFEHIREAIGRHFEPDAEASGTNGSVEGMAPATPAVAGPRGKPQLRAVPVEHLDPTALENLREIKDTPEFLFEMISAGLEDIQATHSRLVQSMKAERLSDVHHDAHTLRGLCVSFGAVRLATIADRLMRISDFDLRGTGNELLADLNAKFAESTKALRELRQQFAPDEAGREGR